MKKIRFKGECPSPPISDKCGTCGHRNIRIKKTSRCKSLIREMIPCKKCRRNICSHCVCSDEICLKCSQCISQFKDILEDIRAYVLYREYKHTYSI